MALAGNTTDATGALNPYERAKVHIAYGYGLSGAGVKVGVVDSGFNLVSGEPAHQDFDGPGKLVKLTSTAPLASDDHGINVSGLLAGERDGLVMHGVAYNATLYLGMSPTDPAGFTELFNEYRTSGVVVSSNSYGLNVNGTTNSPWKPVQTSAKSLEVTARDALAYRDATGLTSAQMMANISGGTAAEWTATVAAVKAYQTAGGVVAWANSNYGVNDINNGRQGLNEVDLGAALPLAFPELRGGWVTVVNGSSRGLAVQSNDAAYVSAGTHQENNIFLNSAPCGLAADFCVTMDGLDVWSGSNTGVASYVSQGGTSQATPQVAGMIALLREAFPAASAADLSARLMFTANNTFFTINTGISVVTTASYTNPNGTITHKVSNVWGHGFPDMQAALVPVGNTVTASSRSRQISMGDLTGQIVLSSAFGRADALAGQSFLFNDQLNGIFTANTAGLVTKDSSGGLAGLVADQGIEAGATTVNQSNGVSFAFSEREEPAALGQGSYTRRAFTFRAPIGEEGEARFGYGLSIDRAVGFNAGSGGFGSTSLTSWGMDLTFLNFGKEDQAWAVSGMKAGPVKLTFGAFLSGGPDQSEQPSFALVNGREATSGFVGDLVYSGLGFADVNLTFGMVDEDKAILGTYFRTLQTDDAAKSRFARLALRSQVSRDLALTGSFIVADTQVSAGNDPLLGRFSGLRSDAWAVNLAMKDPFGADSLLTFGVAQPLAITGGSAVLNLPTGVLVNAPGDYTYQYGGQPISLAPSAREFDAAFSYLQKVDERLSFSLSGAVMRNPGNDAEIGFGYALVGGLRLTF